MEQQKGIINESIDTLRKAAGDARRHAILLLILGLILIFLTTLTFHHFEPGKRDHLNFFTHQILLKGLPAVASIILLTSATLGFRKSVLFSKDICALKDILLAIALAEQLPIEHVKESKEGGKEVERIFPRAKAHQQIIEALLVRSGR